MTNYKINEFFETIQGEGQYTGTASIFIRLQGCPVGCSWCDTKHTWGVEAEDQIPIKQVFEKTDETAQWAGLSAAEILSHIKAQGYRSKHVVITGGEPAMYDLNEMCEVLHANGFSTQIETSGTFEIKVPSETWVTVSPKINMAGGYEVLSSSMARANEVKHPIARQSHVEELEALLKSAPISEGTLVYLQPISQKISATKLAIETCMEKNWRLSIQVHKYIGIA